MSVYQLYGFAAAATDAVASVDIQFNGEIVGWALYGLGSFNAADDRFGVELSFLSSNCYQSNDARGVIAYGHTKMGLLTSGGVPCSFNLTMSGLAIPVVAGERIYLHIPEYSSAGTVNAKAIMYVLDSSDVNLRRRR